MQLSERPGEWWRTFLAGAAVALVAGCSTPRPPPVVPPQPSVPRPVPAPTLIPAPAPKPPVVLPPSPTALPASIESAGVAARFPDPLVVYQTPAFGPGRNGFTSNAELHAALFALRRETNRDAASASVRLVALGASQTGVPIEAIRFTHDDLNDPGSHTARPAVLLVGGQHGDEPAASEALLVIAQELAQGRLAPLLDKIDVVILPRANPDAAAAGHRLTASGIDTNRDHLLLRTPEAQAQAQLMRDFEPLVVVDAHEYPAFGFYAQKFGALPQSDALIQYATTANLPKLLTRASEEWFRQPLLKGLKDQGLSSDWYHTTSADLADRRVAMGDAVAESSRNVNGLRNAVTLLIETRGAGLGAAHLQRRVHTQVTAIASVLQSAALRADDLQKLRRFVDRDVAAMACHGEIVVEAAPTASEYTLAMLDPQTGADKAVGVNWDSTLALTTRIRRGRPCGYWLGADQRDAVMRLRGLGVVVQRIEKDGELRGEGYTETARALAPQRSASAVIAEGGVPVRVKVQLVPALLDLRAGGFYVGLDQPLANLIVAALEPDSPSSFLTHRIVDSVSAQARILQVPDIETSLVP